MNTRILFFDDEPQTNIRLRRVLEEQGYEVCTPATLQEAFREINSHGAELLIHTAHRTKTHWDICNGIFEQYPEFPSIHFATGPASEEHHRKGAFHQNLRPLIPEKDFLRRVRRLVFMGRLKRENVALRKAFELQNRMDRVFDTLDLGELKQRTVDFFAKEFKAKNAFFLSPGGYGFYLQEMYKISTIGQKDPSRFSKHALVSASPSTEAELTQYLTRMSGKLPNGWELRKQRTYLAAENKEEMSFCVIPLQGHKSKIIQGYVLMVEPLLYGDGALERVMPHLTRVLGRHLDHALSYTDAKSLSYIDDLTDLYNQRYLKLVLDKEISRCSRNGDCFSVLFMDIDHFKQVNDTRGHLTGSQVLVELSKILHENIRTADFGFRYGGDEFLLILVGTGAEAALAVAERIRKQVEASTFDVNGNQVKVTLSIGIATYPDHATTKEQILELADRAMYCGKNQSRNVVYVAS